MNNMTKQFKLFGEYGCLFFIKCLTFCEKPTFLEIFSNLNFMLIGFKDTLISLNISIQLNLFDHCDVENWPKKEILCLGQAHLTRGMHLYSLFFHFAFVFCKKTGIFSTSINPPLDTVLLMDLKHCLSSCTFNLWSNGV